ncbi:MAG: phage GP46 family protein [Sphingomicrobium sp.]
MTDLALRWDTELFGADLALDGAALATDDGLKTAVIISLFTDARARDDDPLPDAGEHGGDRRGWWGDAEPAIARDAIGSRLWLLSREKRLPSVVARAREYSEEALAWLVRDGVADRVSVQAEAVGEQTLGILVEITRPAGPGRLRFDFVWEATANAV